MIKVIDHKAEALKWVKLARKMSRETDMSFEIKTCQKHLNQAGLVPEDIGSSIEELDRLSRTSLKAEALYLLQGARKGEYPDEIRGAVLTCREYLERARLTPIAIGSSVEELEELLSKNE